MTVQPITTTVEYTANRPWLAALHGTDSTESITLDLPRFTKDVHYVEGGFDQPHGRVLSGVPVARVDASGLYGPYDPAATDGRQHFAGLVYADAYFAPGSAKVPAALLWHGVVKAAKVPGGLDPSTIAPSATGPQIRFL
ncbi:head decoration protein [Streptomyces sp. B1866]|uniref:head decoration protein n=1 Tax=Streptomyces sp. B1866 TaxID=3075431 RepID=UPI00288D6923|nr:head decoration protein [Streptomyces sp. B1866]MDT3396334.1 head decoration protein [Streptomyces sp. B1866]